MERDEHFSEATRHMTAKRWPLALEVLLKNPVPLELRPVHSYYLGLSYVNLEQYDEALLYLEQIVEDDIGIVRAYQVRMLTGYLYAITRRARLAELEFRRLLEMGYESASVHSALGYALFNQNRIDEALECVEKAVELEPENPNALNSLGFMLAEQGKKLATAIQLCQKALKARPDYPAYLDSLGWAYYRSGKHTEAKKILRQALNQAPQNKEIIRHLKTVMEDEK